MADVSSGSKGARLLQYLQRIHVADAERLVQSSLDEGRPPEGADGLATLQRIHRQHYCTIPFENLSIFAGKEIKLDMDSVFEKLVTRRRGGFCYEHNQLLGWALGKMGFPHDMLQARVMAASGRPGPMFDHMCLMVHLDGRDWLADVGFGRSAPEPLLFQPGVEQVRGCDIYRIVLAEEAAPGGDSAGSGDDGDGPAFVVQAWATSPEGKRAQEASRERATPGEWKPSYRFSLRPHAVEEYLETCRYQQTSPDSHFTQKRLVTRPGPGGEGRVTLSGRKLTVQDKYGSVLDERELSPGAEFSSALAEHFGIRMDDIDEPPKVFKSEG